MYQEKGPVHPALFLFPQTHAVQCRYAGGTRIDLIQISAGAINRESLSSRLF